MTYDAHSDWQLMVSFFDGLGVLLERNLLDISLVEDLFAGRIIAIWERVDQFIAKARKLRKDPEMFSRFEYLYNQIKQRQATITT